MARRQAEAVSARQAKIAAIRAEQERKQRRIVLAVGAIVAVVVVVIALLVVKALTNSPTPSAQQGGANPASSQVVDAVAGVPSSTFDKVAGAANVQPPQPIKGGKPLTSGGKPRVLYVGAEYCPYCAAERWAVVAALSRFGTFHGLGETTSSARDVFPSTPTLSFHGAGFTGQHVAFSGYEMQSNQLQGSSYAPLDKLPPADQRVFQTYDAPPYVPSNSAGSIPFIDIGGKYMISGASYDPGLLKGKTHAQIAKALSDPNSPIAQSVDGTANLISAAICRQTNGQPSAVCTSSGVTAADKQLG